MLLSAYILSRAIFFAFALMICHNFWLWKRHWAVLDLAHRNTIHKHERQTYG
jgi:hypothetical protein